MNYIKFLLLIERIHFKFCEFGFEKHKPDLSELGLKIQQNSLQEFLVFMKPELTILSEKFSISTKSAVLLSGLMTEYNLQNYMITTGHLMSAIFLETEQIQEFENEISELEQKQIINVKEIDWQLIEEIDQIDRAVYDRFDIPKKSDIELCNKTFELTETFINRIINL